MKKKVSRSSRRDLVVGSWKVQVLVESSGDVHVYWKWQMLDERFETVDRQLDLSVGELKR